MCLTVTIVKDLTKDSPLMQEVLQDVALIAYLVQEYQYGQSTWIHAQQIASLVHSLYLYRYARLSKQDHNFMKRVFKQCSHYLQTVFEISGYEV